MPLKLLFPLAGLILLSAAFVLHGSRPQAGAPALNLMPMPGCS